MLLSCTLLPDCSKLIEICSELLPSVDTCISSGHFCCSTCQAESDLTWVVSGAGESCYCCTTGKDLYSALQHDVKWVATAQRRPTQLAEAVGLCASATVADMATPVTAPAVGWWWEGWRSQPLRVGFALQALHPCLACDCAAHQEAGTGWQATEILAEAGV